MIQTTIDWSDFDVANGSLALNELSKASPPHVEAIKRLVSQGATEAQIVHRFQDAFPTWEGHRNYVRLAVRYLKAQQGQEAADLPERMMG